MHRIVVTGLVLVLLTQLAAAAEPAEQIGRKLDNFQLEDYRGREYSLADFEQHPVLVIAILGTECPLAKLYASRLAQIATELAPKDVAVIGLNSNAQDSLTEIAAFARRHQLEFPILKDTGNRVADQLAAVRTPEVFVLDQQRVVRYWGRIDDQYDIGVVRDAPKRQYLREAVDELLAGKPVQVPSVESVGCRIGRQLTPQSESAVTYSEHVAPILREHCASCHRPGEIGPFSLTSYDEAYGWAETIAEVVGEGRMPPWHADPAHGKFRNENRLTDEQKQLIADWVAAGAPQGDASVELPPLEYVAGWQLPREPDLVLPMREQPVDVPATGEVRYQYYTVDPGFTEDKWIQAAELVPGNRSVVHHILVFARNGEDGNQGEGAQGFLVGYVPGLRVEPLPPGYAKRVPAGSKIVFQVHYTPNGSPQQDLSKLGLIFANPSDVTHEVTTVSSLQPRLNIPPGDANHRVEATGPRLEEVELLSFMPHMHLRGKSFRYIARYPGNTEEILLDVPRYDFNWQTAYRLAEPKLLPAGTRMHCIAHYDNSEGNLNNPDPEQTVRWGDQTWNEMMIGYFDIAMPKDRAGDERERRVRQLRARASEIFGRLDKNQDEQISREEAPETVQRLFDRIDADGNGNISEDELVEALKRQGAG